MDSIEIPAVTRQPNHAQLTVTMGALAAFAPFATDMYLASFSSLAQSFHASASQVQLTLSIFFIGLAIGQPIYGPLIDRYGRRGPLLIGVAAFVLSSALCTVAPNIETLIGLRLLQAVAGCSGMIVSRAIIRDLFEVREAARVLSHVIMMQVFAPVIAPLMGSYILAWAHWQAIFAFLALFGAACFIATAVGVRETLPPERRKVDRGIGKTFLRLLQRREFIVQALSGALAQSCMFAFISGSPFVFMELHGVSPQQYGWLFGINALGMVCASQLNRVLLARFAPRTLFRGALALNVVAGLTLLSVAGAHSLLLLMIPLWFCIATMPVLGANSMAIAMNASGDDAGSASALIGLLQFTSASLASGSVALLHNGTAYPMAATIAVCGSSGACVYYFLCARHKV